MKFRIILTLLALGIASCGQRSGPVAVETQSEKMRREVISISENYASAQLKDPKRNIAANNIITIEDSLKRYVIDPAKIYIGQIDSDTTADAIATVLSFSGQDLPFIEHLIIVNTEGKLIMLRSVESDFRILQLKNRILTVEIHTKPRTSPLYNCQACRAIVNYKFEAGDLVRTE